LNDRGRWGRGLCGLRGILRFTPLSEGRCVWVWRRWATLARSEDELGQRIVVPLDEDHVAAGAVEQFRKNFSRRGRSVLTEDALVADAAGDFQSGIARDLPENLVEARVLRGDGEHAVRKGDLRGPRRSLCRCERNGRRLGRGGLRRGKIGGER